MIRVVRDGKGLCHIPRVAVRRLHRFPRKPFRENLLASVQRLYNHFLSSVSASTCRIGEWARDSGNRIWSSSRDSTTVLDAYQFCNLRILA